ncbi:MAG TPA: ATP-binding cassette domain-containing protein, partial [Rectinemataceae bacterium]|nr:ATP-binding cassette domain-containing protein [Rectinemataceae bacterium]
MDTVLSVSGLRKSYGTLKAVDGVDIAVGKGEIFGLLGHNGAGKTTTIECILGTRKADA